MDPVEETQRINILEKHYEQALESRDHDVAEQYSQMERNYLEGLDQRLEDTFPVEEAVRVDRDYDQALGYILEQSEPEYSLKE